MNADQTERRGAVSGSPGSTPAAVAADGEFDAALQKARLRNAESTAANPLRYEWRYCDGPNYSTETESVVPGASIPAGGVREIVTDVALANPGDEALFRLYVITTTGNEKGSNDDHIVRPAATTPL